MQRLVGWIVVAMVVMPVAAAREAEPTRLSSGPFTLPTLPGPGVVGWGEVILEVDVAADGAVAGLREVRTADPFGHLVRTAVAQWRFEPARAGDDPVASSVVVAAVYRPRGLHNTPAVGTPAVDVGAPAVLHPLALTPPAHPPQVLGDAVVVVEVLVDAEGTVRDAAVRSPATGFDGSALDTARRWRFAVASGEEMPSPAYAYLIFGFREPVVSF
jgi:TonB family protein